MCVFFLLPAVLSRPTDPIYMKIFLATYQTFMTPPHLLLRYCLYLDSVR